MSPLFLRWTSKVNKKRGENCPEVTARGVMCENIVCLRKAQPSGSTSVLF